MMKVIDLLNKIANGEEVPKKIKYDNQIYELTENKIDWYCCGYINFLGNEITMQELNNKVEIIEEDKKIEKIYWKSCADNLKEVNGNIDELSKKINEIIDYLEENK